VEVLDPEEGCLYVKERLFIEERQLVTTPVLLLHHTDTRAIKSPSHWGRRSEGQLPACF